MLELQTEQRSHETAQIFNQWVDLTLKLPVLELRPSSFDHVREAVMDTLRAVTDRLVLGSPPSVSDRERELVSRIATVARFLKDPAELVAKWQAACGEESPVNFANYPHIGAVLGENVSYIACQFEYAIERLNARLGVSEPNTLEGWADALRKGDVNRALFGKGAANPVVFGEQSVQALRAALGHFVSAEEPIQRWVVELMFALSRASQVIEYLGDRYRRADEAGRERLRGIVQDQMQPWKLPGICFLREFRARVEEIYEDACSTPTTHDRDEAPAQRTYLTAAKA